MDQNLIQNLIQSLPIPRSVYYFVHACMHVGSLLSCRSISQLIKDCFSSQTDDPVKKVYFYEKLTPMDVVCGADLEKKVGYTYQDDIL